MCINCLSCSAWFSSEHYCRLKYAANPQLSTTAALVSLVSKFYLILCIYIDLNSQQCVVALRKQLADSLNYIGITAGVWVVVVIGSIPVFPHPCHPQLYLFRPIQGKLVCGSIRLCLKWNGSFNKVVFWPFRQTWKKEDGGEKML